MLLTEEDAAGNKKQEKPSPDRFNIPTRFFSTL